MPGWLKVLLVTALVFVLIVAAGAVVAYRWARHNGPRLLAEGKQRVEEGRQFGEGKQGEACVAEALARVKNCDGFRCELTTRLFLDGCVKSADSRALCAAVPKRTEFVRTAQWTIDECARRGMDGDERCRRMLQNLPATCEREASK